VTVFGMKDVVIARRYKHEGILKMANMNVFNLNL